MILGKFWMVEYPTELSPSYIASVTNGAKNENRIKLVNMK